VPAYVIDAPGGGGKIPLLPDYLQRLGDEVELRNFRGERYTYRNAGPAPVEQQEVAEAVGQRAG